MENTGEVKIGYKVGARNYTTIRVGDYEELIHYCTKAVEINYKGETLKIWFGDDGIHSEKKE